MSRKFQYTIMGLFFATLAVLVFIGIGLLTQSASKKAACDKLTVTSCNKMDACNLMTYDACEDLWDKEAVCTSEIKSSVQDIEQCNKELAASKDCEGLPESCLNLE